MTHTNSELQTRQQLWYDRPAVYWEEALPLGNGRLGAMLYYLLAGVCYVPDGEKDRIPGCPDRLADAEQTV